jgi:hypothetical protein
MSIDEQIKSLLDAIRKAELVLQTTNELIKRLEAMRLAITSKAMFEPVDPAKLKQVGELAQIGKAEMAALKETTK